MSKVLKSTLLALAATAALAGPAQAKLSIKDFSFTAVTGGVGDPPALVFLRNGNDYETLDAGPYTLTFRLKAKKRGAARIEFWDIFWRYRDLRDPSTRIVFVKHDKPHLKALDKTYQYKIGWRTLKEFEEAGRALCKQKGKPDEKVITGNASLQLHFRGIVATRVPVDEGSLFSNRKTEYRDASIPIRIVCLPEPLKVKKIDLKVRYEKLPGECRTRAQLTALFHTNKKAGKKFDFWLYRDDGNTQKVTSRNTDSNGRVAFNKSYTFNSSVDRKYMVGVPGDFPIQSKWVPMKVSCMKSGPGGINMAPKPSFD